jgi:membrane dipeptidase
MKLFDLHADIGMHVLTKVELNEIDILKRYHIEKLHKGEIFGVGMACFFEGHETLDTAYKMVESLYNEIHSNPETIFPYKGGEFDLNRINALMTVEGMCFIKENPEEMIDWLYEKGVRIGSLSWNDENALSTGVRGNPLRGLTPLGQRTIKQMNLLNMIIDISHTNEKSFWDIITLSDKPVIATHSNTRYLSNVDRNLTDQQISAIIQNKGLIGLVAAKRFVSLNETLQNAKELARHASHIKSLGGINNIAIGFDYMDFLEGDFGRFSMASDLQDASESQNLISALYDEGFTQEEVELIAFRNVSQFFRTYLK